MLGQLFGVPVVSSDEIRERLLVVFENTALAGFDEFIDALKAELDDIVADVKAREEALERAKYAPIEERKWSGYDENIYYHPEKCGLSLICTAEEDEAYEFHYCCLWQDIESQRYFMATDSGCSCPTPFEDFNSVSDLTEVKTVTDGNQFLLASGGNYTPDSMLSMLTAIKRELSRW